MPLFSERNRNSKQLGQFVALAKSGTEQQRRKFLLENPVFCSLTIVPDVMQIPQLASVYGPLLAELGVNYSVQGKEIRLGTDDSRYPVGEGVLERTWKDMESGDLSPEDAFARIGDPTFGARLSSLYISALSLANLDVMKTDHGTALRRHLLVMRAVDAADPEVSLFNEEDHWKMRKWAGAAFVEIVGTHLCYIANSGIFRYALNVGEALARESEDRGELPYLARILERLGVLHLDPYTAFRDSRNYTKQTEDWRERADPQLGEEAAAFNAENPLPEPLDALATAVDYLERALQLQQGRQRLGSLCALTQALVWRRALLGPWDQAKTRAIAQEAMGWAQQAGDASRIQQLTRLRDSIEKLDSQEPVTFIAVLGRATAREMSDADWARKEAWLRHLDALTQGETHIDVHGLNLFEALQALPREEDPALVAPLTRLAFGFFVQQKEEHGMKVFEHPAMLERNIPADLRDPIRLARAQLTLNAAVNLVRERRFGEALRLYQRSLDDFAMLQLSSHVEDCLGRVTDLARHPEAVDDVLMSTRDMILSFERSMSTRQLSLLQNMLRATNTGITQGAFIPDHVSLLWQLAKGYRFGLSLQRGLSELTRLDGPPWHEVEAALAKVDFSASSTQSMFDDPSFDLLLYAGSSRDILGGDATRLPPRVLYDRALESALVHAAQLSMQLPYAQPSCVPLDQLQARIGPRTVLLNYFLGTTPKGALGVYLLLITQEGCKGACIAAEGIPSSTIRVGEETGCTMAPYVAEIRDHVQQEPSEGSPASEGAMKRLRDASEVLLSGFAAELESLRANGKTHVCIVPHGPLHFLPFHLIEVDGQPLASRWAVSYLPNLNLLKLDERRPRSPNPRLEGVAAFAAGSAAGYGSLPEAIDEARSIADAFGTEPRVGEKFDRDTLVMMLMTGYRYMHIAGHGEMDVEAPCFHHLVLGSKDDVEKFHAFQLQRLDLRGLDLLTLSACETALGRFDVGDNLRGLPAYLFLCGVSAIIGTLWRVETNTARTFFVELYGKLKEGEGRLESFVHAQRETRKKHPEYRDWGAFVYLGDYSHPIMRSESMSVPGMSGMMFSNMQFAN